MLRTGCDLINLPQRWNSIINNSDRAHTCVCIYVIAVLFYMEKSRILTAISLRKTCIYLLLQAVCLRLNLDEYRFQASHLYDAKSRSNQEAMDEPSGVHARLDLDGFLNPKSKSAKPT